MRMREPYLLVLALRYGFSLGTFTNYELKITAQGTPISACCLYCDDLAGKLLPTIKEFEKQLTRIDSRFAAKYLNRRTGSVLGEMRLPSLAGVDLNERKRKRDDLDVDGVDADLYGDDDVAQASAVAVDVVMRDANGRDSAAEGRASDIAQAGNTTAEEDVLVPIAGKRFWCFVYGENGTLEVIAYSQSAHVLRELIKRTQIFSIPDFEQVFYFPHFDLVPSIAYDHYAEETPSTQTQAPANNFSEILVVNMGRDASHKDPYFIVRYSDPLPA